MSEWFADIWVSGHPRPQGSMTHVGRGRLIHKPTLIAWRETIYAAIADWAGPYGDAWEPISGPVDVDLHFYLPKAKSNRDRLPTGSRSGDCDKHARSALDGISLGDPRLIHDDSQVVRLRAQKAWAHGMPGEDGHEPGMRLRVRPHE